MHDLSGCEPIYRAAIALCHGPAAFNRNGILHCHTTASDGTETLEAMADATRKRGFEYYGVADHSQSAHYAGGLTLEEIAEQHHEADRLNKRYGGKFRILKGIEADILADGWLDYPDDILEDFDFVVASVHSRFKLQRSRRSASSKQSGTRTPQSSDI